MELFQLKFEQEEMDLKSLMIIISSLKQLVRQGRLLEDTTILKETMKPLKLYSEKKPSLKMWLQREQYTHPKIQIEIIKILGKEIVNSIVQTIRSVNPLI